MALVFWASMADPPLDVSPLAALLLDLAGRGATGRLLFGERTLLLRDGELADVVPADGDPTLEQRALEGDFATAERITQLTDRARREGGGLIQVLQGEGLLDREALARMRRELLRERLSSALTMVEQNGEPLPVLEPAPEASRGAAIELVTMVLDALVDRIPSERASEAIAAQLNRRLEWNGTPLIARALQWAELGELPDRPALSTVLAKAPQAAPRIAALLRAGLVSLTEPGRANASQPQRTGTLPPPPPRLSAVPSRPAPGGGLSEDPLAELSARPPRMRLDPGQAEAAGEPLLPTKLARLPEPTVELADPLVDHEQRVAQLETADAPGPERARAFCALADLWRNRLGSVEQACRWFREAAAADPTDARLLEQAALHCHYLGEPQLAARYASGAVEAAGTAIERAGAQRLRAKVLRAAGDVDGAVEALCEAAADDPTSPEPHELVAAALLSKGNVEGANAHARLGAAAQLDTAPQRAGALLDFAWASKSADVPTAYEFASLLDSDGRRTGAVAVLEAAAAQSTDPDGRRKLRLAAAQRAEAAQRPDLAAELLALAFDAEPHFDLLYAPLEEDLKGVETPELRAALLEDVATACPEAQRAHWLTRAGVTTAELAGERDAACWLFYEAVLTDPTHRAALEALRKHAATPRALPVRAHALRACIAHALGVGDEVEARLTELAELADGPLSNPELARAAWTQLERLGYRPDGIDDALARLDEVCEQRREGWQQARARLDAATPDERAAKIPDVLGRMPDLPEHWPGRMALLAELDGSVGLDERQRAQLETLHGLARDAVALAAYLDDAAERTQDDDERVRLLRRLAAVHTVREDTMGVAVVVERLLALDPSDAIGHARLERAARKLGDGARLHRALTLRLSGASGVAAGRLRARLAQLCDREGREREAAAHALEALALDPEAADAALVYLRTAHQLDAPQALRGMDAVRGALGASRRLYLLWIHAARAAGDEDAARSAAEAWARVLPMDGLARAAEINARVGRGDAAEVLGVCGEALSDLPVEEVVHATRSAIERLAARGELVAAAQLSLRVAEEQGRPDQTLAAQTVSIARRAGMPEYITRALELQATHAASGERAAILIDLAAHHRDFRDHVGEARALLRILEHDAGHDVALRQLEALFRAAGDAARAAAVSTLALDTEQDAEQRRRRLLDLTALHAFELRDLDAADYHVRQLIAESSDDSRWLRLALGALFEIEDARDALARCVAIADECPPELGHRIYLWAAITAESLVDDVDLACRIAVDGTRRFPGHAELLLIVERISLSQDDAELAMTTYDELVARAAGPHGRRALLYRAGRWLERSGRAERALAKYLQAFELAPTGGAALKAVERMARATDELGVLLSCYQRLADNATDVGARVDLLCAAAELCTKLGGDERALSLYMQANALTEGFVLDDEVLAAAGRAAQGNPAKASETWRCVTDDLRERVEQLWDAQQKVSCLIALARVLGLHAGETAESLAQLDAATAITDGEDVDDERAASIALARAEVLAAAGKSDDAWSALRSARELEPDLLGIGRVAEELGEVEEPTEASSPPSRPRGNAEGEARLRAKIAEGDGSAVVPLSRVLLGKPEAATEARKMLRDAYVAQPWSTATLRALHDASVDEASTAERWVCGTLLSVFDPRVERPPELGVRPGLWRDVDVRGLVGEPWSREMRDLLVRLWECARSVQRFRNTPQELGISERDRISRLTGGPVAEAYALATRVLGTHEVPVYVAINAVTLASVLPTHPPSVVAARRVGDSLSALRYEMARALWLAQPEYAIPAVLERQDAVDLLDATRAAFASRTGPERLSVAATEVAAGLWQALPAGEQREIERVLTADDELVDYDRLRAQAMDCAARAALIASGALAEAVAFLAEHDPALATVDLTREPEFGKAARRSSALASTVQAALSDGFLAAVRSALAD